MRNEEIELIEEMIINCRNKKDYVDDKAEQKAIALEKLLNWYKNLYINQKNYYLKNKEKYKEYRDKYRKRKAQKLREQGITNPWVVINGGKPKFKEEK